MICSKLGTGTIKHSSVCSSERHTSFIMHPVSWLKLGLAEGKDTRQKRFFVGTYISPVGLMGDMLKVDWYRWSQANTV